MAASDATPFPVKNQAYRVTFPILDADGDLVTAAGSLDSEVSKDGGTFADCTNEATEIATGSGMYYLDLTATEMNADTVAIIVKSTGGKTTPIVLYPQADGLDRDVNVTHWNGTAVATPTVAGVPEVDITHYGGSAGTFASGRPEVNSSHVAGTAQTAGDLMGSIGEENAAAAAGDPSTTESLMQYIKQLVNVLVGTSGIATFPAEAAPANAVSLAEVIRAIHSDVTGINGDAMRGTDSAALASVCTEARLSELDAATAGKMANQVDVIETDTTSLNDTKIPDTLSLANIKTQAVAALNTDAYGEPGQEAPGVSVTLVQKIGYLYKAWRNKSDQTSSLYQLYNSGATVVDQKATVSSDGTTSAKEEVASGP